MGWRNWLGWQERNRRRDLERQFVRLIQLARADPALGTRLRNLLAMDDFNRQSVLNTWLEQLELQGAPEEMRRVLACLLDDRLAHKARDILLPADCRPG